MRRKIAGQRGGIAEDDRRGKRRCSVGSVADRSRQVGRRNFKVILLLVEVPDDLLALQLGCGHYKRGVKGWLESVEVNRGGSGRGRLWWCWKC